MKTEKQKSPALVFDADDCLWEGFSWGFVRDMYGIPSFYEKYKKGEISLFDWTKHDIKAISKKFKKRDLPELLKNIVVDPEFEEIVPYFEKIKKKGGEVYVLSAGFPPIVKHIAKKYGMKFEGVKYLRIGKYAHLFDAKDADGKERILEKLEKKYNVTYFSDRKVKGAERDYACVDKQFTVGEGGCNFRNVRPYLDALTKE